MDKLNKIELKRMVSAGLVSSAIATRHDDHYKLVIETPKKAFLIKTRRDAVREFKTLLAVEALLGDVGIKSFSVVG